jgi:hypothetical protein
MSDEFRAELLKMVNKDVIGRLPNVLRSGQNGFITRYDPENRIIRVDHVDCQEFWMEIPLDSIMEKEKN